jgi:hypothetical protein
MNHKNSLMIHGPISLNNEVLMIINDHEIFIKKSQPGQALTYLKLIHKKKPKFNSLIQVLKSIMYF